MRNLVIFTWKHLSTFTCLKLEQDQITTVRQALSRQLFAIMVCRLTENQADLSIKQHSLKDILGLINLEGPQGFF